MKTKQLLVSIGLFLCPFMNAQTAGNALNFDGSNDYISASLPSFFSNPASVDFTIETWVRPSTNSFGRIFSAQATGTTFVSILVNNSGNPYLYVYDNGLVESQSSSTVTLPLDQWSHVACTWLTSTQTITIYINGVMVSTTPGGTSSNGTDGSMAIGAKTNGTQVYTGDMDEFRIWSEARTACDIIGSMNTTYTNAQPNLIASYSFNQGVPGGSNTGVTTLTDFTGSYNGTLTNFGLSGTTSNWVASGATINSTNQNFGLITSTDVQSSCGTYTWIDGNTYTSSNNSATFTVINPAGCDTLKTLNLTILAPTSGTDTQSACESYSWIDGNTYTSSNNTVQFTLVNAAGCDSTVTLDLTINVPTTGTDVQTACETYTWIDGNTYTSSNNSAQFTLTNSAGCDSVVTLDLSINSTIASITNNAPSLTASPSGASYQWIDCDNGNALIQGETNETFVATSNGNYAVIVTENNCSDTSACENVSNVGMDELKLSQFKVYPNPNNGRFTLEMLNANPAGMIQVFDARGKEVYHEETNESVIHLELSLESGCYFLIVNNEVTSLIIE